MGNPPPTDTLITTGTISNISITSSIDVTSGAGAGAFAASALSLLLEEDPLLTQHNLIRSGPNNVTVDEVSGITSSCDSQFGSGYNVNEEAVFSYAASLLKDESSGWMSSTGEVQQRASEALTEVDRKLALVQSLYERVARESPEAVAGPLLRLHGYEPVTEKKSIVPAHEEEDLSVSQEEHSSQLSRSSLTATRERCSRLRRQGEILETIGKRVESSLTRGLRRMESTTCRLERILQLSSTLKMTMRLQFEMKKVSQSGIDFFNPDDKEQINLRDLTRAAASVAAMEELLHRDPLDRKKILLVEKIRPKSEIVARKVRSAAAGLLQDPDKNTAKLGATLQVYYHLKELPEAVWRAAETCLASAEKHAGQFFNPAVLSRMLETANAEVAIEGGDLERRRLVRLRQKRQEAAIVWTNGGVKEASLRVWNLHRVLLKKTDPSSRTSFQDVFKEAPIPETFAQSLALWNHQNKQNQQMQLPLIPFSLFTIYWNQVSIALAARIQRLLKYDNGNIARNVSDLYPAVRAATLSMLDGFQDAMRAGGLMGDHHDPLNSSSAPSVQSSGILGGSLGLDKLPGCSFMDNQVDSKSNSLLLLGPDSWTRDIALDTLTEDSTNMDNSMSIHKKISTSSSATTSSPEWNSLHNTGLQPLKRCFLEASRERLHEPLFHLFPEAVQVDEHGVAVQVLPTLPSRYDISKVDAVVREELALANPREGGGELGMATMIAANIVHMVKRFCNMAKQATSQASIKHYLNEGDYSKLTEAQSHDQKLLIVMHILSTFLQSAPDKTFVVPYRPSQLPQHEEASCACQIALSPAIQEIQSFVRTSILTPLSQAWNDRVSSTVSQIHKGIYFDNNTSTPSRDIASSSFVQILLTPLFEHIASNTSKLPAEYGGIVTTTIASYSIYSFLSNASLIRPLGESSRLRITQDLADLELALEQLVFKGGSSSTLHKMDGSRPYAELRAMRQMLYWAGLEEDPEAEPAAIAKGLLREMWIKDVRPSTLFHYLLGMAPSLLSSPHHFKRMNAEDYVKTLVDFDGHVEEGEEKAWLNILACCDAYRQRESVEGNMDGIGMDGDRRVASVLMILGPELMRRRG